MKTTNDNNGVTVSTKKDVIAKVNSLLNTMKKKQGAVIVNAGMKANVPSFTVELANGETKAIYADYHEGVVYNVCVNDEIVARYYEIAPNRFITNEKALAEIVEKRQAREASQQGRDELLNGHTFDVKDAINFIRQHKGWATVPMKAMELTRQGGEYLLNNTRTRNQKTFTL